MVTNMTKAIQQIMLGTVTKNEKQAAESLKRIKAAGYDGIELNGFTIKPLFWSECSQKQPVCRSEKAGIMTGMPS